MHIHIFFFMQGFKSSNAFTVRMIMLFSEIEVKNSESLVKPGNHSKFSPSCLVFGDIHKYFIISSTKND